MKLKTRRPEPGPILSYISLLPTHEQNELRARVTDLLTNGDGAILLDLLTKSIRDRVVPVLSDPRASEYLNAQRLILTDLEQIVRSEDDYLLDPRAHRAQRSR